MTSRKASFQEPPESERENVISAKKSWRLLFPSLHCTPVYGRMEAEKIEFESYPRLICDWLSETDLATDMDELSLSDVIFDKHQIEFETLDFLDCHRNHEYYSGRAREKDHFLG